MKLNTAGDHSTDLRLVAGPISASDSGGPTVGIRLNGCKRCQILFQPGKPLYMALYAAGIIGFAFVYTSVVFNTQDVADNLKK
ncbi:MAG: hypothetical protein R3C60_14720 [Parvularculaceae bacterium]